MQRLWHYHAKIVALSHDNHYERGYSCPRQPRLPMAQPLSIASNFTRIGRINPTPTNTKHWSNCTANVVLENYDKSAVAPDVA